jgi:DNA-binding Lrp family transcriptional regulator
MDEIVMKIIGFVRSNLQLTCRMIADQLDMSEETIRKILIQVLSIGKLAVKLMP